MASKYFALTIFFVKIITISCQRYGSLSLVIDDTQSMEYEIDSVKSESSKFMDTILTQNSSQISDVVIVTFNDPVKSTLRLKPTRDRIEVKRALESIHIDRKHWGGDCPEYSLAGINTALANSRKNSYLFVFTDASPKDGYVKKTRFGRIKWEKNVTLQKEEVMGVKNRAMSQESTIFFFITKSRCHEKQTLFQPYWDIAAATNGQVYNIKKKTDLEQFLKYMNMVISGGGTVINTTDIKANEIVQVPFTVDNQTEFVRISASTQGDNVYLNISSGPTSDYEKIVWTDNNKILMIKKPAPGNYTATVKGSDHTTVMIFGRTDFTFQHGFSETIPPTFSNERSQPTEGKKSRLLIKVYDPKKAVNIKTVQISSQDEKKTFGSLALTLVSDGYYATDSFLAPTEVFVITVVGEGKRTGESIKRTSQTPIQPRPQNMDPEISIQGGGKHNYNTDVILTCYVKAYPRPKITWRDNEGNILDAMLIEQKDKKDFVIKLLIKNLKHKKELYCFTVNDKGDIVKERVDLDIHIPFKFNQKPSEASIVVEFGKPATLQCDITADIPMEIIWIHIVNGEYNQLDNLPGTHSEYSISNHGRKLTINKVNQDYEGQYICEAFISDDKMTKFQLDREIELLHTAPTMGEQAYVEIKQGESKNIPCTVLKGYPKPKITWEFKDYRSTTFRQLPEKGDRLQINNANLLSAGIYKCVASNDKGTERQETAVTVSIQPQAKLLVNGSTRIHIEYNKIGETVLNCIVLSHSHPDIVWKNGKNQVMKTSGGVVKNNDYEYKSTKIISQLKKSETYYCEATNKISTTKSNKVYIDVSNPFQKIPTDLDNNIEKANYGEKFAIPCGITSSLPIKRTWYKETGEVVQTSDKYLITENGATLTIRDVNSDTRGKYRCKASIIGDEATQETRDTTVDITVSDPEITTEGGGNHKYNTNVLLKCKVKAYPKPKIIWTDDNGKILPALSAIENEKKYFVSKLLIPNLKHKMVFYCNAESTKGNLIKEAVEIDTQTPFKVNEKTFKASFFIEFGKPAIVQCDITADVPIEINWYRVVNDVNVKLNNKPGIHSEYSISNHGTKLTINKVNQNNEGRYICEASVSDDKETKYQLKTNVNIEHTAPIMGNTEYVEIKEGESKSLSCRILKGYPKPEITWMFKGYGSKVFQPLLETSDSFLINNTNHLSAGVYRCRARNYMGEKEHDIAVTVSILPQAELLVNGKTRVYIAYNNTQETVLICHVLSHSRPAIVWKNGKNEVMKISGVLTKNNEYEYVSKMIISHLKKSEMYHCEATNQISTIKSNKVFIEVSNPFNKAPVVLDKNIKKANNGERVEVPCGITSPLPIKITWYKETGERVQTSDKYLITDKGAVLIIRKMDMDTSGKYRCNATITGDEATHETHDTTVDIILENPVVETKHRDLEVIRNHTALLKCKVMKGFPKPVITWMVKYEKSNEFVTLPDVGEELNLSPASYNHAGVYKCVLKNKIGSDEGTVRLLVKGPPEILTPNDIVYTAIVGDETLVIPCDAVGYPKPVITWSSAFNIKINVNSNNSLVIKNPTTDDSDMDYVCTATNEFGNAEKTFVTFVGEIIGDYSQDMGNITNIIVLKDTPKEFKCESGSLKGRWFKNGEPTKVTGTMVLNSKVESYDDGSIYHATNYTCRINDITGSKSYTYSVKIEYKPILKEPLDKLINWDGTEQKLSCDAYMQPEYETAEAKWYYNGKESSLSTGSAHQSKHPIISWGHYSCNISNYHGFAIKNYYVNSSKCLINMNLKGMKLPYILNKEGLLPEEFQENYLVVDSSENLLLSCNNDPARPNHFEKLRDVNEIIGTCVHEDKFKINGKTFSLSDLQCNNKVTPVLKETGEKCFTDNTELIKVGYNVQIPEPSFVEVYSVCFDKSKNVPIYSKTVTQGDNGRIDNPVLLKYDKYYKKSGEYCTKDTKCCLGKQQLLNDIDMPKGSMKLATYIDGLNSIAYWHDCSTTVDYTWSDLDNEIRLLELFTPYTKISGALDYTSINGIMVPRYLWKFVHDGSPDLPPIVIVIVNDPSPTKEDIRCTYECPMSGWTEDSTHTFCCEGKEFMEKFNLSNSGLKTYLSP